LMESAVAIGLWILKASLFTFQNTFTKISFDTGRVLDELFDGDVIFLSNDPERCGQFETDPPGHLLLDEFEDLLLHTYEGSFVFRPFEKRDRNVRFASISVVLVVLTMNFLSKIDSAGISGSRRSWTGFLNWFVK